MLVPARRVILRSNPDAESGKFERQHDQHPSFMAPRYVRLIQPENSSNRCLDVRDDVDDGDHFYHHVARQENFTP